MWACSIVCREHEKLSFSGAPPIANVLQGKDLLDGVKELLATRTHSTLEDQSNALTARELEIHNKEIKSLQQMVELLRQEIRTKVEMLFSTYVRHSVSWNFFLTFVRLCWGCVSVWHCGCRWWWRWSCRQTRGFWSMILKFYRDRSAELELQFLVPSLHCSFLTLKFLVRTLDGSVSFVVLLC